MALLDIHSHRVAQYDELLIRIQSIRGGEDCPESGLFSMGIHPWFLQDVEQGLQSLESNLPNPRLVAIGEAGLDRFSEWPESLQIEALRRQIEWSEAYQLPLILHVVKSWDGLLALMKEYKPQQPWIVHGFRHGQELANQLMDAGLFLSFGPRHNKDALRVAFARSMGLLESDEYAINLLAFYYEIAQELGLGIQELQRQVIVLAMALFPRLGLSTNNLYLRTQS